MNMMHHDPKKLGINSRAIESSEVIPDQVEAQLVGNTNENDAELKTQRTSRLIMTLLCIVVGFYIVDNLFLKVPADTTDTPTANLSLNNVLVDGVVDQEAIKATPISDDIDAELGVVDVTDGSLASAIPSNIVKFIDADLPDKTLVPVSKDVVLEELKKPLENTINAKQILLSGNRLFNRDRLMSPPNHNAYARYEKVLSVYPDHPEALKGIQNIVDRYVYLADMVIRKKEHYKVPGLIKNAYEVGEKYMDVTILLDKFSKYLLDERVFLNIDIDGEEKAKQKEKDIARQEMLVLTDKKISSAAYKLYINGDVDSAKHLLENFVGLTQSWGEAKDLLLKIYLTDNDIASAEKFIDEDKTMDIQQLAEKAARIMMTRDDNQTALDMLEAYKPAFTDNEQYYTILAGLYHKTGDFKEAVYWYRKLLAVDHENARLWLGLAVSLDALNEVDEALQAFDYVKLYAQEESVVKQYIDERLLALAN